MEGWCVSPEIQVGLLQGWEYLNQGVFSASNYIQFKEHCPDVPSSLSNLDDDIILIILDEMTALTVFIIYNCMKFNMT